MGGWIKSVATLVLSLNSSLTFAVRANTNRCTEIAQHLSGQTHFEFVQQTAAIISQKSISLDSTFASLRNHTPQELKAAAQELVALETKRPNLPLTQSDTNNSLFRELIKFFEDRESAEKELASLQWQSAQNLRNSLIQGSNPEWLNATYEAWIHNIEVSAVDHLRMAQGNAQKRRPDDLAKIFLRQTKSDPKGALYADAMPGEISKGTGVIADEAIQKINTHKSAPQSIDGIPYSQHPLVRSLVKNSQAEEDFMYQVAHTLNAYTQMNTSPYIDEKLAEIARKKNPDFTAQAKAELTDWLSTQLDKILSPLRRSIEALEEWVATDKAIASFDPNFAALTTRQTPILERQLLDLKRTEKSISSEAQKIHETVETWIKHGRKTQAPLSLGF